MPWQLPLSTNIIWPPIRYSVTGVSARSACQFVREPDVPSPGEAREPDPLALLLHVNTALRAAIAYVPKSILVDSPINHALESRQGVRRDFADILTI